MPLALITGGARRIGASIALGLADAGFDIALHVNSSLDVGCKMIAGLKNMGVRAELFALDLNRIDEIEPMFEEITKSMGSVDLVVNNASIFAYDSPVKFDHSMAENMLRVNLLAPARIVQSLADNCTKDALAINMLDNKVFSLNPDYYSYTLSKVALKGATEMMAMGFAGRLRVNAIAPGITLISDNQSPENFDKSWRKSLSGVGATPAEIADTVLFIWNTKSINGETIVLDGGQRLMGLERDVAFLVGQGDD